MYSLNIFIVFVIGISLFLTFRYFIRKPSFATVISSGSGFPGGLRRTELDMTEAT